MIAKSKEINKEKLFTVIIAVYNDENRIVRCLNSLTNQTSLNFDVIVVNDGSKDNTSNVIEKFINENITGVSINYIDKKINAGVSSARNDALDLVSTKYIFFLDSDDYFDSNVIKDYEAIVKNNEYDFYSFSYMAVYSDIEKNKAYRSIYTQDKEFTSNEFVNELLIQKNGIYAHCCTKLYNSEIIKKYDIKFNSNVSFMEDLIFNLKYTIHCNKILHVDNSWYNYVQSENSLSKSCDEKMITNFKMVLLEVYQILKENKILKLHSNEYKSMYNRLVILAIKSVVKSNQTSYMKKKTIDLIYETFDVKNKIEILENKYYFNDLFGEITKIIVNEKFDLKYIVKKLK